MTDSAAREGFYFSGTVAEFNERLKTDLRWLENDYLREEYLKRRAERQDKLENSDRYIRRRRMAEALKLAQKGEQLRRKINAARASGADESVLYKLEKLRIEAMWPLHQLENEFHGRGKVFDHHLRGFKFCGDGDHFLGANYVDHWSPSGPSLSCADDWDGWEADVTQSAIRDSRPWNVSDRYRNLLELHDD